MPQPTPSDVHVSRPLTNISVAYLQANMGFSEQVFPIVPVDKQADRYFVYSKGDWNRDQAKKRAPSTESAGGGWSIDSTPNYYCDVFGFHKDVDDDTRANSDQPLDMDRDSTLFVTQILRLRRDKQFATDYLTTGVWGTDRTGVASGVDGTEFLQWNDDASTPIEDIADANMTIMERTGFKANVLTIGPHVYNKLKRHPDILDRIKYTQRGIVTLDLLATLFDVEKVVVAWTMETTSAEGATVANSFVAGKVALLTYSAPSPSLMMPSAGYTFAWRGLVGSQDGMRMKKFRIEAIKSDRIEGELAFANKVVASDCGFFFTSAVA